MTDTAPADRLGLKIGGLELALSAVPHDSARPPPGLFDLDARTGPAEVELELAWLDRPEPVSREAPVFTSPNWRAYRRADGGYDLEINWADGRPEIYRYVELFGERPDRGRLHCVHGADLTELLSYPTDEVLYLHLLAPRGGLIVHACAVVDRGLTLLFPGNSGAGKTTLSRRWAVEPGVEMLTDERCILRSSGGTARERPVVHGSPWAGEGCIAGNGQAPLGAIFFLRQAKSDSWRRLQPGAAAARLLACSFPPLWEEAGTSAVISAIKQVVERVPSYELSFLREGSCVPLLRAALDQLTAQP